MTHPPQPPTPNERGEADLSKLHESIRLHAHGPIGWAKSGEFGNNYLMDKQNVDTLSSDIADYTVTQVQNYITKLVTDALDRVDTAFDAAKVDDMFLEWNGLNLADTEKMQVAAAQFFGINKDLAGNEEEKL